MNDENSYDKNNGGSGADSDVGLKFVPLTFT